MDRGERGGSETYIYTDRQTDIHTTYIRRHTGEYRVCQESCAKIENYIDKSGRGLAK